MRSSASRMRSTVSRIRSTSRRLKASENSTRRMASDIRIRSRARRHLPLTYPRDFFSSFVKCFR